MPISNPYSQKDKENKLILLLLTREVVGGMERREVVRILHKYKVHMPVTLHQEVSVNCVTNLIISDILKPKTVAAIFGQKIRSQILKLGDHMKATTSPVRLAYRHDP